MSAAPAPKPERRTTTYRPPLDTRPFFIETKPRSESLHRAHSTLMRQGVVARLADALFVWGHSSRWEWLAWRSLLSARKANQTRTARCPSKRGLEWPYPHHLEPSVERFRKPPRLGRHAAVGGAV